MKKKILLLATLAVFTSVIATGTLAFFTDRGHAHNVITTGKVGIELVEKMTDSNGTLVDFPKEGVDGVMPGGSVSKIVRVKNTGDAVSWIRIWVNVGISEAGDPITNPTIKNLPLTITKDDNTTVDVITLDYNTEKWIYEDGYYYYTEPVPVDKMTEPLFRTVTFAPEMGNEYQNCKITIDVSAEAVQYDNNDPRENGGDVTDVKGWPEV